MAKKAKPKNDRPKKVAFQVRFDSELHAKLAATAEEAGLSLNQLVEGMCEGSLAFLHQGEPVPNRGMCSARPQQGCVFFGRVGYGWDKESLEIAQEVGDVDLNKRPGDAKYEGECWWSVDHSGRAVRVSK